MTRRKPRHVSFRTLARILPGCGSREAALLTHVFRCEVCTEKALSILKLPPLPTLEREAYDGIFARTTAKALEAHAWRTEQRARAASFVSEILSLPDEEAQAERIRQLSRVEPWSVIHALLQVGEDSAERDPARARTLARLALLAIQESGLANVWVLARRRPQ